MRTRSFRKLMINSNGNRGKLDSIHRNKSWVRPWRTADSPSALETGPSLVAIQDDQLNSSASSKNWSARRARWGKEEKLRELAIRTRAQIDTKNIGPCKYNESPGLAAKEHCKPQGCSVEGAHHYHDPLMEIGLFENISKVF